MINQIIHLVTNRSGDFHHPSLASAADYVPHVEPADEASLREFLHLKDIDTDYYIIGALTSIYAFPELVGEFNETDRNFDLSLWKPDDDAFSPGDLDNSSCCIFNIHRVPTEYPVVTQWDMSYLDATSLLIQLGTKRWVARVRESATKLYVDWPAELGLQGAVELDGAWTTGYKMTLLHTPSGFPYEELARQIANREDARRILTDRGYMPYFFAAQSDLEKCAILYTALAWPSQYG